MTKDSLKNLLNMFPYFLDKREGSNFYKSQKVSNLQFQDLYQSLFDIHESFHLQKRCLIWKQQDVEYDYFIHFFASYPNLKSVKCYKNDNLIYIEEYNYEDNVDLFIYVYDSTMDNNIFTSIINDNNENNENNEKPIIPEDRFHITVETYDEIVIEKGFPENDIILGDIYDHDISLDRFGKINNIPRKEYIETTGYAHTEPPYNNRLTEDDYHYMNRIIEYTLRLHDTPLPVLEIWKLYGLKASMINRERFLLKVFDEEKHPFDEETEQVLDWTEEKWEHKDGFYNLEKNLGKYFFINPSTNMPKKGSSVTFRFKLLNNLAEELTDYFTVDIYLNNNILTRQWPKSDYTVGANLLDENNVNYFRFVTSLGDEEIIEINVRGCNNSDWYVDGENGNDENDGSKNNPFKSLSKALEKVTDVRNMVVVKNNVNVTDAAIINNNVTILGCGEAVIENNISNKFFKIIGNKNLTLSLLDVSLHSNGAITECKSADYVNTNKEYSNYLTVLVHGGTPSITNVEFDKAEYYPDYDNVKINGIFLSKEELPIKNEKIIFSFDDIEIETITNNQGEFSGILPIRGHESGEYSVTILFNGSQTYFETSSVYDLNLTKEADNITTKYGEDVTITATGYNIGDDVRFYHDGQLLDTITADNDGEASLIFTPHIGANVICTSLDGISIDKKWNVGATFKISDLPAEYLVTDVSLDSSENIIMEKKPLSDFSTVADLTDIILDVYLDNDDGVIYLTRFESNYDDESILENDELYPLDLEDMKRALTNLYIDEDIFIVLERMNFNNLAGVESNV